MKEEQDFLKGFMFAEQVLFGLNKTFDFGRVLDRLEAIARGDVVTGPTAAEAVRTMERQTGKSLPRAFRTTIYGRLSAEGVGDTDARKARFILESMGYLDSDWTAPRKIESVNQPPDGAKNAVLRERAIGSVEPGALLGIDDRPTSVAPTRTIDGPVPLSAACASSAQAGPATSGRRRANAGGEQGSDLGRWQDDGGQGGGDGGVRR
jgi:hypothetical protein